MMKYFNAANVEEEKKEVAVETFLKKIHMTVAEGRVQANESKAIVA